LTPILGGPVQTLLRLGSRFSLEFQLPKMRSEPDGRTWASALVQAKLAGAIVPFLQDGFVPGSPGSPVVNGAGQSGTSLAIRGAQPNYRFRDGQFWSLVHGGRRYLHMTVGSPAVASDGTATITFVPMLRVSPSDGAAIEVAIPKIQGSLIGEEIGWDVQTEPWTDLGSIRIDEDA